MKIKSARDIIVTAVCIQEAGQTDLHLANNILGFQGRVSSIVFLMTSLPSFSSHFQCLSKHHTDVLRRCSAL